MQFDEVHCECTINIKVGQELDEYNRHVPKMYYYCFIVPDVRWMLSKEFFKYNDPIIN